MSFKSSALQEEIERQIGRPLFECEKIPEGENENDMVLSFKSDQQKGDLYDLLRRNEQHQTNLSLLLNKDPWTINSMHTRDAELPNKFRLSRAAVLENWERATKASVNPTPRELRTLNMYEHNLKNLDAAITDFKVFELPSLFSSPYNATSYVQYLLVIDLITCLMKIFKNPNLDAVQPYRVHLCDTHTTSEDMDIFSETLKGLSANLGGRWTIKVDIQKLGKTLNDINSTMPYLGASTVLIMIKPLNPIRQLLQHIMVKYSKDVLPLLIICKKATVDIPIEKKPKDEQTYMAEQSRRYGGDRTSDLVEKFFEEHYHPYSFIVYVPPVELLNPGRTVGDSAAVSDLVKDLVMYIRKDVYQKANNKPGWAKHWNSEENELNEKLLRDIEGDL